MSRGLQVVIPMAGEGKRFADRGYTFAKPLISIRGKPMIQWVLESLNLPEASYTFVVRSEHRQQYALEDMIHQLVYQYRLVDQQMPLKGAADTVLQAVQQLDSDDELLIVNSDQWVVWDPKQTLDEIHNSAADGAILTFPSVHPKWSFAKPTEGWNNWTVERVAEKVPISGLATAGIYWFKSVQLYAEAAKMMMAEPAKMLRGEYYVCPVYNELIDHGKRVIHRPVGEMWGLGTPEDLEEFKMKICR